MKDLQQAGMEAERAWGSNGKALGEAEDVDVVARDHRGQKWRIQAKRRAKLAAYMKPSETNDLVMLREDHGKTLVVMRLDDFIDLTS